MNEEVRKAKSIEVKLIIERKAHCAAIEQGKTLGRWIEDAIEEKLEREREEKQTT